MTRARSLPSGGEPPRDTEREPESGEHTELIPVMTPPEARRSPDQTAPPPEDPLRGTPYRFVQALSTGGEMGEIVEAEHTALRRRVIVKLLGAKLAGSEDFADRMRLEGQALAAAAHPNVVTILDVGKTREGRSYVVMEKLVGRTLEEELAERRFVPVAEAVALVRQLLDGLDAAHGAGVVHRDVKPANLFICDVRRGPRVLKILDFGVAKLVRRRAGAGGPEPLAHPTVAGAMVGTPRWMAPEQILTEPVGPPTDIYSAGAVLYALVAGHDPFSHHRDRSGVLQAHVGERPPVPSIGAPQAIPTAVEHAIMKALEKRPEDRWASAAELSDALERALAAGPPVSETRPATLPAPARQTADRTRTMGGGTAIQSAPRSEPATPPHALAVSRRSGPRLPRRMPWPTVLGALVVAAVVGTLVGVPLRGHRRPAAEPARASFPSASPLAPLTAAPALPSPTAPSAIPAPSTAASTVAPEAAGSASTLPAPVSARPSGATRGPRRVQDAAQLPTVAVVASVARPPDPPPPTASSPKAAHRAFGLEE